MGKGKEKENTFMPGRNCALKGTCRIAKECLHAATIYHEIKTLHLGPEALRGQVVGPKCHHPSEGSAIKAGKKALENYTPTPPTETT